MAKRAQEKSLSAANKLMTWSVSGYSNDSTPFGDSNLTEAFVWPKKIEKDIHHGASLDEVSFKAERLRETMALLEKVKKRREETAKERALHEEYIAFLARERARTRYQDWISLDQRRVKPIDVLYKYLVGSNDMEIDLSEPYMVFKGLTVKDMKELLKDIKMYLDWDQAIPTRVQYWEALIVRCIRELAEARRRDAEARRRDALDRARVIEEEMLAAQERGLHAGFEADVRKLLHGKTQLELIQLQFYIESQLHSGAAEVVKYWEAVLTRLNGYRVKALLKQIKAEIIRSHRHRLEQRSNVHKNHVVEEQRKRFREAMDSNRAHVEDSLGFKAMKRMGEMEEARKVMSYLALMLN